MKRYLALLLTLLLLHGTAMAEMDTDLLASTQGMNVYLDRAEINTIYRPEEGQPFEGVCEEEDISAMAYLDFVTMPEAHATLMRLTLSMCALDALYANQLELTIDGKAYVFPVSATVDEYDLVYYEDYSVYLTDESLPLVKAIAKSKRGVVEAVLMGETETHISLVMNPKEVARLYDLYVDAGGNQQDLTFLHEDFPVTVIKAN